jgi:hypothetical protein
MNCNENKYLQFLNENYFKEINFEQIQSKINKNEQDTTF